MSGKKKRRGVENVWRRKRAITAPNCASIPLRRTIGGLVDRSAAPLLPINRQDEATTVVKCRLGVLHENGAPLTTVGFMMKKFPRRTKTNTDRPTNRDGLKQPSAARRVRLTIDIPQVISGSRVNVQREQTYYVRGCSSQRPETASRT